MIEPALPGPDPVKKRRGKRAPGKAAHARKKRPFVQPPHAERGALDLDLNSGTNIVNYPASKRAVIVAASIVVAMIVAAGVAFAHWGHPGVRVPAFLPFITGAVLVTELMSAFIFLGHYRTTASPRILFLGLAYLCSGFFIVPYLLTFPGVFSPSGLFGANEQTAVCLWFWWHGLFPTMIVIASVIERWRPAPVSGRASMRPILIALAAVACAAASVTFILVHFPDSVPTLVSHGVFARFTQFELLPVIVALDLLAIAGLLAGRRPYAATTTWLIVSLAASSLDALLGLIDARYSMNWYVGKVFSMVSSTSILMAYILEMLKMQSRLAHATDELRHINQLERRKAQRRLVYLAYHDEMTGLHNRTRWQDLLRAQIDAAAHGNARPGLTVMFVDLDCFKDVNDALGHAVGDEVLIDAGRRLCQTVPKDCVVGRLGGDEFGILLTNHGRAEDHVLTAGRVLDAMRRPFELGERSFALSASIGIARYPEHGATTEVLLQHSDIALYHAKRAGGDSWQIYAREMGDERDRNRALREALMRAIRCQEFQLHYQPLLDLRQGEINGVEALIRWIDPVKGVLLPDEFVPVAEETGLMDSIGKWTFETAIAQARQWNDAGHPLKVSVNVSTTQLRDTRFFEFLRSTLKKYGVPAKQIQLEVTESAAMADAPTAIDVLTRCRALGMTVALDDFGTHYSSLTYLQRLPLDSIKIDASFVRGVPSNKEDVAIVRSVISLGHHLDRTVVAEGVETVEQFDWLRSESCDIVQGYLVGRPMDAHGLLQWKRSQAPYDLAV
jgi:diguanylate cyclase (GGDEF)-like protein